MSDAEPVPLTVNGDWWSYPGRLERVVDADTYDMTLDLGFNQRTTIRLRLADVDCAEKYGVDSASEEYRRAVEQEKFVIEWFHQGYTGETDWPFYVYTGREQGSFGRWLCDITRLADGAQLQRDLLESFSSL